MGQCDWLIFKLDRELGTTTIFSANIDVWVGEVKQFHPPAALVTPWVTEVTALTGSYTT